MITSTQPSDGLMVIDGGNALCSLIQLLEHHPYSNYEVYILTKTPAISKILENMNIAIGNRIKVKDFILDYLQPLRRDFELKNK